MENGLWRLAGFQVMTAGVFAVNGFNPLDIMFFFHKKNRGDPLG